MGRGVLGETFEKSHGSASALKKLYYFWDVLLYMISNTNLYRNYLIFCIIFSSLQICFFISCFFHLYQTFCVNILVF